MPSRLDQVQLTPLKVISTAGGAVRHLMRNHDAGFRGFGEAYLSEIERGRVRGWKRHRHMTLNLAVVTGSVRIVVLDDSDDSTPDLREFVLDRELQYARLTVPPGLWTAFQGIADPVSTMINIADIPHDPAESDTRPLDDFPFSWPAP